MLCSQFHTATNTENQMLRTGSTYKHNCSVLKLKKANVWQQVWVFFSYKQNWSTQRKGTNRKQLSRSFFSREGKYKVVSFRKLKKGSEWVNLRLRACGSDWTLWSPRTIRLWFQLEKPNSKPSQIRFQRTKKVNVEIKNWVFKNKICGHRNAKSL